MLEEMVVLKLGCVEIKDGWCVLKLQRCGPKAMTCNNLILKCPQLSSIIKVKKPVLYKGFRSLIC